MAVMAQRDEQLLIGGDWVEARESAFEVTDPATGEPVGSVPDARGQTSRRRSTPPPRR